jgi:hypothetical protein
MASGGGVVDKLLTVADLRQILQTVYPEVENDRDDEGSYDHPMAAVGLVLLSAAIIETQELVRFTGYSRDFISAITSNLRNNKLWIEDRYDTSAWLSAEGIIDQARFWDHIEFACGMLWQPDADSDISADPCSIYWDEGRRPSEAT